MMAYLAPAPLLLGFVLIFLGRKENAHRIAMGASLLALAVSLAGMPSRGEVSWEWFRSPFPFEFGFVMDELSMFMLPLVAFITTLVMAYSGGYMEQKEDLKRYYACMCLFAFSMMGIVLANNFLLLFLMWELVGLSSYLLIGFWYQRKSASKAMRKAFTIITIGDIAMFAGMAILMGTFGTLNFKEINTAGVPAFAATLLILIGAFSKSAQFPLHVWLPDAMEGPTPVSALLHSATMVKAGIFLMARLFPLILVSGLLPLLAWVGMISVLLSATLALVENDVKRVLAYSSISHLGFMTFALGLGAFPAALFHMFNHSFFKAMLFLTAGILIHQSHSQDIGKMSFQSRSVMIIALVGVLALAGVPPLNGFWSKDQIIEASSHTVFYPLALAATFLSALYIFRWFFTMVRPKEHSGHDGHIGGMMFYPVALLSAFVVLSGFAMGPFYGWFENEAEFHIGAVFAPLGTVALAFVLAFLTFYRRVVPPEAFINNPLGGLVHKVLINRYWLDDIYEKGFAAIVLAFSTALRTIDKMVIDGLVNASAAVGFATGIVGDVFDRRAVDGAVNGVGDALRLCGGGMRKAVTGLVQTYMSWVVGGVVVLIFFLRYLIR